MGRKHTEEWKKKHSHDISGEKNWLYGKHLSEETKRKLSEAMRGRYCRESNPFYGRKHSEATRRKMSEMATPQGERLSNVWQASIRRGKEKDFRKGKEEISQSRKQSHVWKTREGQSALWNEVSKEEMTMCGEIAMEDIKALMAEGCVV